MASQNEIGFRSFIASGAISAYKAVTIQSDGTITPSAGNADIGVGITQQEIQFPHAPVLHRRELTIMGSRNALTRDFARIIRLIEEGTIDTGPWITHRAKFDDVIAEFPTWLKPETGVIKAIVAVT